MAKIFISLIHNVVHHSFFVVLGGQRPEIYMLTSLHHHLPFCTSVNPSSSIMGLGLAGLCTSAATAGTNCGAPSSPLSSSSSSHSSSSPSSSLPSSSRTSTS